MRSIDQSINQYFQGVLSVDNVIIGLSEEKKAFYQFWKVNRAPVEVIAYLKAVYSRYAMRPKTMLLAV